MAIVQSVWTEATVNGHLVLTCTVLADATLKDAYTLKTPANTIDGSRPFTVFQYADGTPDATVLPVQIWVGYASDFALTGDDATLAATSGSMYKQINNDCVLAVTTTVYSYLIHPNLGVADVVTVAAIATGYKVNVPPSPYYALCLNGGSTLAAQTTTWKIVQKQ